MIVLQFANTVDDRQPVAVPIGRVKYLLRAAKSRGHRIDRSKGWRYLSDCALIIRVEK